jgi:hypothetical protein
MQGAGSRERSLSGRNGASSRIVIACSPLPAPRFHEESPA